MITTTLSRPDLTDPALGVRWRAFAQECDASFFQDWTWIGCLAAEKYTDPVLVEAHEDGRLVGLALFNRHADRPWGETLSLHETGQPAWDAVFTEHNDPLVLGGRSTKLQVLARAIVGPTRRLVLSGVGSETVHAAHALRRTIVHDVPRAAPFVDFARVPAETAFIDTLSRNTRHQLRRSNRDFAALGDLVARRACSVDVAMADFTELVRLHDASWRGRGSSGAFARPEVRRFHHALIADGVPRGEVDLVRVSAGRVVVGLLMNFTRGGSVSAYQSGFDYAQAGPHMKPGLTSHYLAIQAARQAGAQTYDFLAGPSRYKSSFANAERTLHWLSVSPRLHPVALRESAKRWVRSVQSSKS